MGGGSGWRQHPGQGFPCCKDAPLCFHSPPQPSSAVGSSPLHPAPLSSAWEKWGGGGWAKNLIPKPEKGREGGREGSRESFAGKSPLHPAPLSSLREKKGRGARILIPKPAKVQTKKKGGGVGGSQRGKGEAFAAKSDKWD